MLQMLSQIIMLSVYQKKVGTYVSFNFAIHVAGTNFTVPSRSDFGARN